MTIAEASSATGVYYPTVKAIQKVYATTGRIDKIRTWKQKVKRKRCKRRDPETVYVTSSSSEPHSSDFCNGSAAKGPKRKPESNGSQPEERSKSALQNNNSGSINGSAQPSIQLMSVSDTDNVEDKRTPKQESNSSLIGNSNIRNNRDKAGHRASDVSNQTNQSQPAGPKPIQTRQETVFHKAVPDEKSPISAPRAGSKVTRSALKALKQPAPPSVAKKAQQFSFKPCKAPVSHPYNLRR